MRFHLNALALQKIEELSRGGSLSGRGGELFPDDNFGAEREKVKKRLAGIVLHADAAMGVWGSQDIADMETDAVISEAHEERHGGAVEIGAVVAILLTDAEEAGGGGVPGTSACADGKVHSRAVSYNEETALGGEVDHDEEPAGGTQGIGIAPRVVGERVVIAIAERAIAFGELDFWQDVRDDVVKLGVVVFLEEFGGGIAVELLSEGEGRFSIAPPEIDSGAGIQEHGKEFRVIASEYQMHEGRVTAAIQCVNIRAISQESSDGGDVGSVVRDQEHESSTTLSISGVGIEHDVDDVALCEEFDDEVAMLRTFVGDFQGAGTLVVQDVCVSPGIEQGGDS